MNKAKISASALAILGTFLATSANAKMTERIAQMEQQSVEAAQVLRELHEAGLVQVDPSTGQLKLKGSVLEVLQQTGWATSDMHSIHALTGDTNSMRSGTTP